MILYDFGMKNWAWHAEISWKGRKFCNRDKPKLWKERFLK